MFRLAKKGKKTIIARWIIKLCWVVSIEIDSEMAQFAIISRQRKGRRQQHSLGRGFAVGLQLMNCRVIRSFRWAEPLPGQQAENKRATPRRR